MNREQRVECIEYCLSCLVAVTVSLALVIYVGV